MDTAVFPVNDNELIWLLVPAKPTTTKHIYDHLKSNRYTRRHVYLSIYLSVTPSGILFSKCPELTNTNQAKYQLPMRNYILFRRVFKKSALIFQPRTHSLTRWLTRPPHSIIIIIQFIATRTTTKDQYQRPLIHTSHNHQPGRISMQTSSRTGIKNVATPPEVKWHTRE